MLPVRQPQFVGPRTGDDGGRFVGICPLQYDAELADDRRQRTRGVVWRLVAPEAIDETLGGDGTPLLEAEPHERKPSLPSRKVALVDGTAVADDGDSATEVDP